MRGSFTASEGSLSLSPSAGEIPPPPSDDIEEMLPVGFSALEAIAASPVLDVDILPPPPTDSDSRPSSTSATSSLLPLDGPSGSTPISDALPETTSAPDQRHDLTTFDVDRGFWRVYHGARELLRYANIYQEHKDSLREAHGDARQPVNSSLIPREIDLESMTQLSWGVTRAVADINAYDRRMHILSGRQRGSATLHPDSLEPYDAQRRISKRKKKHSSKHASSQRLHQQEETTTSSDTGLAQYHVCKACGTLHSPQWRYGPEGLLNLCNVCGLLHAKKTQRKMIQLERERDQQILNNPAPDGV